MVDERDDQRVRRREPRSERDSAQRGAQEGCGSAILKQALAGGTCGLERAEEGHVFGRA